MFLNQQLSEEMDMYLSQIKAFINMQNSKGLFNINKYCEDFFCGLLNIIYDLNLTNLNIDKLNFTAVDLGDFNKKICIQVTSSNNIEKIRTTIIKFEQNGLYNNFKYLRVFILGDKKNYYSTIDTNGLYDFDLKNSVMDFIDFSKYVYTLDSKKVKLALEYVKHSMINPNVSNINRDKQLLLDFTKAINNCVRYLINHDFSVVQTPLGVINDLKSIIQNWQLQDSSFTFDCLEKDRIEIINCMKEIVLYLEPPSRYMQFINEDTIIPVKDPERILFNKMKDATFEMRRRIVEAYQRLCSCEKNM